MWEILLRENKRGRNKKHFWCVGLANDNRILYIELVSLGTVNSTMITPSEVLELASIKLAVKLILVHNHPNSFMETGLLEELKESKKWVLPYEIENKALKEGEIKGIKKGIRKGIRKGRIEGKKEGLEKGIKKGKGEGLRDGKIKIAQKMLLKGVDIKDIVDFTGLSKVQITEL